VLALLSALAAPPALSQDPELESLAPATTDALLRSSCYCIGCSEPLIPALTESHCKFIRWGGYPWINAIGRTGPNPNYQNALNSRMAVFADFAGKYKAKVPGGVVELVLPEIVTHGVEIVVIEPHLIAPLASLNLVPNLNASYRFVFTDVRYPRPNRDPDHYWNQNPAAEKNGVPSLASPAGRLWAAYLAARAIESGADSIGFAQPQLRVNTAADLELMVRKIRRLRQILQPNRPPLLFGVSSSWAVRQANPPVDLARFIDYTKFVVDMDAYRVVDGQRVIPNPAGGWLPCQLVGRGLDPELLPTSATALAQEHMCMLAITQRDRPAQEGAVSEPSFNASNPYRLRMLLELDGAAPCFDKANPSKRVVYYEPDGAYQSTCLESVRHALPTTMFFLSRSSQARQRFIRYLYELARSLSAQGPGVYFPLPINVDQNRMDLVLEKKDCRPPCSAECASAPYARPTQVALIPGCPRPAEPQGRFCAVATGAYVATECKLDFETTRLLLPR
jgi:hypothetical protein